MFTDTTSSGAFHVEINENLSSTGPGPSAYSDRFGADRFDRYGPRDKSNNSNSGKDGPGSGGGPGSHHGHSGAAQTFGKTSSTYSSFSSNGPNNHHGNKGSEKKGSKYNKGKGFKGSGKKGSKYYNKGNSMNEDGTSTNNSTGAASVAEFFSKKEGGDCPFYSKIGACRHGTACSRQHIKCEKSRCLLLAHLFAETKETFKVSSDPGSFLVGETIGDLSREEKLNNYDDEEYCRACDIVETFYEELFAKMALYGEIEDLILVDNISDHMAGNVYVKYYTEDSAVKALNSLEDSWYNGRKIKCEYSPCLEFRDARCRSFCEGSCPRGQNCNFLHLRHIPKMIKRNAVIQMYSDHPEYEQKRIAEGRPVVYKTMSKIDWGNDGEAREDFKKKWWAAYNQRRKAEKEWEAKMLREEQQNAALQLQQQQQQQQQQILQQSQTLQQQSDQQQQGQTQDLLPIVPGQGGIDPSQQHSMNLLKQHQLLSQGTNQTVQTVTSVSLTSNLTSSDGLNANGLNDNSNTNSTTIATPSNNQNSNVETVTSLLTPTHSLQVQDPQNLQAVETPMNTTKKKKKKEKKEKKDKERGGTDNDDNIRIDSINSESDNITNLNMSININSNITSQGSQGISPNSSEPHTRTAQEVQAANLMNSSTPMNSSSTVSSTPMNQNGTPGPSTTVPIKPTSFPPIMGLGVPPPPPPPGAALGVVPPHQQMNPNLQLFPAPGPGIGIQMNQNQFQNQQQSNVGGAGSAGPPGLNLTLPPPQFQQMNLNQQQINHINHMNQQMHKGPPPAPGQQQGSYGPVVGGASGGGGKPGPY